MVCVLDTSALIAVLKQEVGWEQISEHLAQDTYLSEVNRAEFYTFMVRNGQALEKAALVIQRAAIIMIDFDKDQASAVAELYSSTKQAGLSLGDRACLALAQSRSLPVITADKAWQTLDVGVEIRLIR